MMIEESGGHHQKQTTPLALPSSLRMDRDLLIRHHGRLEPKQQR
jgi:hypothetical protein